MEIYQLPKIIKETLNTSLINKFKQKLTMKETKNIRKNLLNLAKADLAELNQLKVKVLIDKEEEKRKKDFVMVAPVCFKQYFEDFKKKNNSLPEKRDEDEITPSSADTVNQIDSSDLSVDEKEKIM